MNVKSSIHITSRDHANSEAYNSRAREPDYLLRPADRKLARPDDTWVDCSIAERQEFIHAGAIAASPHGRPLRSDARPIREGVVNLEEHHTMVDLKRVADEIKKELGIEAFQIFIHRDEGRYVDIINGRTVLSSEHHSTAVHNFHAHMVFDYLDYSTGKKIKPTPKQLSTMQDIVARELGMERGKVRGKEAVAERLTHLEDKLKQCEKEVVAAQEQATVIIAAVAIAEAQVAAADIEMDEFEQKKVEINDDIEDAIDAQHDIHNSNDIVSEEVADLEEKKLELLDALTRSIKPCRQALTNARTRLKRRLARSMRSRKTSTTQRNASTCTAEQPAGQPLPAVAAEKSKADNESASIRRQRILKIVDSDEIKI